jgi:EamA domain-containing membrane protein RarD
VKHVRNFAIVAALAFGVYALPGGNTAADLFGAILFVILTLGIGLLGARLYQQRNTDIMSLGEQWRLLLYGALGLIVVDLAASPRLFDTGLGTVVWIALLCAAGFGLYQVWRHSRQY